MSRSICAIALCVIILSVSSNLTLLPLPASAEAYISGTIAPDTGSNLPRTPYIVNGNLMVEPQANLTVQLTSPVGFAVWRIMTRYYINWTATGGSPPVLVDVGYRTMTGPQFIDIARDQSPNGSIHWQVPMTALGLMVIRAQAHDSAGNVSNATANVLVIPGFIVLVTPAAANVPIDRTQTFTARAIEINGTPLPSDKVLFTWSLGNTTVGKVDPAGGNVTTFTPIAPGTDTLTCIALYEGSPSAGFATVTIPVPPRPDVTLIIPVADDSYPSKSDVNIIWKVASIAPPFKVNISYSKDGGAIYTGIVNGLQQPKTGAMSYIWKLPTGLNSDRVVVNVTVSDRFDQTGSDESGRFSVLVPLALRYISGSNQTGDIVTKLGEPLVVQVLAQGFIPLEGVGVDWSVKACPNGSTMHAIDRVQTITDSAGISRIYLHFGERPGLYSVMALLNDSSIPPVIFNESALPGAVVEAYIFPKTAVLTVGEEVRFSLVLYDSFNNTIPVVSANVTWSIDGIGSVAGGTFSSSSVGGADVHANIAYKGKTVRATAHVEVHAQDASVGLFSIGLIILLLILGLFLLLYQKRRARRPPKVLEKEMKREAEEKPKPVGSDEKKVSKKYKYNIKDIRPKEGKAVKKSPQVKKIHEKIGSTKKPDMKAKPKDIMSKE